MLRGDLTRSRSLHGHVRSRLRSSEEIVAWGADRGISGAGWGATINADDEVLPDKPLTLVKSGRFNQGEILVGSNKNEWGLFLNLGTSAATINNVADLNTQIDKQFAEPAALNAAIKAHYTATDATAQATFVRLMTDVVFRCPSRVLAREASAQGSQVYVYSFEQGQAWHAFELPYVFGNPNPTLGTPTLVEPLATHLQSYWTAFAKSGDPNGGDRPEWPMYDASSDEHITLAEDSKAASGLAKSDCDFWDQINAQAQ